MTYKRGDQDGKNAGNYAGTMTGISVDEEGKIYGSLSYLVICFEGREKAYRFLREENLDALLDAFRVKTDIPVGKNN